MVEEIANVNTQRGTRQNLIDQLPQPAPTEGSMMLTDQNPIDDLLANVLTMRNGSDETQSPSHDETTIVDQAEAPRQREPEPDKLKKRRTVGNYWIEEEIGEGTFGKVRKGTHKLTKEIVAIKILEKSRISDVTDVERVAREIHILKLIRHPNIVQLYEIIETPGQLYLIMEFAPGGELFDYIVKKQRIPEKEACKFFQ